MTDAFVPPPPSYSPILVSTGIRTSAGRTPDKVALTYGDARLTFRRFVDRIDRVCGMTKDLFRLERGQTAAIVAANCIEFMEIICGLSDMGVPVAMLNPKQTPAEIGFILNDCGARVVFVTPDTEESVRAADAPSVERIVVVGKDYEGLLSNARPATTLPAIQEWEPFSIPYTSGTTGKPRGVTLPHRSRVMNFFGMAVEYGCYSPVDHYLAHAPLFHGGGYAFAHAAVFFGGSCEILSRFDAELVLAKMHETPVTGTFMVPTHFHAMFALDKKIRDRNRGFPLKTIISNAAPLPQRTKELIVEYFGEGILHETYGSTEAAVVTNLRPEDQLRKQQCVGKAFVCTHIELRDDDGKPVKQGDVGELWSTSPYLFNGYWKNPEATKVSLRDGWVSAGDVARMDDEGYIYIVDRKKDMFISGGVNVYPREIEEQLFRIPGVKEAAVVGMPDDYWGETGCAFVVTQPGAKVSADDVLNYCRDKLAGYKVPKAVSFIDALPRNAAGKVLKTDLRKRGTA
ncbi:MAG: class I adenylate-forming enzyme family protein [Alphaproteobacteria bacterium]